MSILWVLSTAFLVIVALTIRATVNDDGGTNAVRHLIWCIDDSFSYAQVIAQTIRSERITDAGR